MYIERREEGMIIVMMMIIMINQRGDIFPQTDVCELV
jgi:hypothetical protein